MVKSISMIDQKDVGLCQPVPFYTNFSWFFENLLFLDNIYFWCISSIWTKGFETFQTSNLSKANVSGQFRLLRLIKLYVQTFFYSFFMHGKLSTENCPLDKLRGFSYWCFRGHQLTINLKILLRYCTEKVL